jgi:hypothetical protein
MPRTLADFDLATGLKILWPGSDEIEFISPRLLNSDAAAGRTAAMNLLRGYPSAYVYPVDVVRAPEKIELQYKVEPADFRETTLKLHRGSTEIEGFRFLIGPEKITWRSSDGDVQALTKGTHWAYRPPLADAPQLHPRKMIKRTALERPDQARLKAQLLAEREVCEVTKCSAQAVLEACHILPVENGGNDDPSNALLLRRDIHALFDAQLLHFEKKGLSWVIVIDETIGDETYMSLNKAAVDLNVAHAPYLLARQQLLREHSADT